MIFLINASLKKFERKIYPFSEYTDHDIEGTEIEGTVLKFLKNKGHQYWNLLPQGTGEIQI